MSVSDIAIRAEDLSKLYHIGQREPYFTLRDTIAHAFIAPFRWFGNGQSPIAGDHISPSMLNRQSAIRNSPFIWSLKDISFEVKQGEVVGVIGRNGAGKSTLLKILAEITEPTEGRVEINGRVGSLLEVGTGFHPELTGRENIYLNGAILGMKKKEIESKFDEIVAFAEIEKFLDMPVKYYSSGMYMRLAFSVAAHLEPEILLVDEVLAVGDAAFQKKCVGKIEDVRKSGRTILFVSHNLNVIASLCTTCLLLDSGRMSAKGSIGSCMGAYLKTACEVQGALVKTSDLSRPFECGERLRIQSVSIQTTNKRAAIPFNSPLVIDIAFLSNWKLPEIVMGLGINSLDGTRIITCHSDDSIAPFETVRGTSYAAKFCLSENQLNPGMYNLDVSARSGGHALDYLTGVMQFEILGHMESNDKPVEQRRGFIRLPSNWNLTRL